MSKVKVINLKSHIEASTKGKYTSYKEDTMAVLEGPDGVILIDTDGVHEIIENLQCTQRIHAALNDNTIKLNPNGFSDEIVQELLNEAPVIEQPLVEYIQWFGSRIESNYRELLKSIETIGLNPDDFKKQ